MIVTLASRKMDYKTVRGIKAMHNAVVSETSSARRRKASDHNELVAGILGPNRDTSPCCALGCTLSVHRGDLSRTSISDTRNRLHLHADDASSATGAAADKRANFWANYWHFAKASRGPGDKRRA